MSNPRMHRDMADNAVALGGFLRCDEGCGRVETITADSVGTYLRSGWPKCHGYTMRWWTQRQVDAGEVPTRSGV